MRKFFVCASLLAVFACSSNDQLGNDAGGNDSGDLSDVQVQDVATGPLSVTFTYKPQWAGVTAITVIGGFGQSGDWTSPFATLADDGTGTFKATAMLPAGAYLYAYKIIGDTDSGNAKYMRYAIDPNVSAYAACPSVSPTYDANNPNPCSSLTVPQGTPAALVHVTGLVVSDGAPIAGYLVQLDREEASSHHFFVNRVTTKSDGAYDLLAAPGSYRLQILHPTYLSESDEQRNPVALAALRRDITTSFPITSAPVVVPNAEIARHDYGSYAPITSATLPTAFTFTSGVPTHLDVYGTGMDGGSPNIGDPWYTAPPVTTGTGSFDGGFNTSKSNTPSVALGERYFWGVEETLATDAGVTWTAQSMVFPITWH